MKCPQCGQEMDNNAVVCTKCGFVLNANINPPDPGSPFIGRTGTKSKYIAAVLALFFGALGIHDFYLGFNKKAIIKIVLSVFSLGTISAIWGFVDFVRILTGSYSADAYGNPLV